MEVLNDLVGYKNLKIYQNPEWFSFSLDSVLLPNFVTLNKGIKNILDLGTGNLPIPLILSTKTNASITAVEIQKDIYDLAKKTLEYNKLQKQITLYNMDMLDLKNKYPQGYFDVILSNPPYFKYLESSNLNYDLHKTIARHEKCIDLESLVKLGAYFLKNKGVFALVHRTERFIEIVSLFNKYNLSIKKVQFIYPKENQESNLVLIEGVKCGKIGLKVLKPLFVHNEDGSYRDEVLKMFE